MDDTPIGSHRVLIGFIMTAVLALTPVAYALART